MYTHTSMINILKRSILFVIEKIGDILKCLLAFHSALYMCTLSIRIGKLGWKVRYRCNGGKHSD